MPADMNPPLRGILLYAVRAGRRQLPKKEVYLYISFTRGSGAALVLIAHRRKVEVVVALFFRNAGDNGGYEIPGGVRSIKFETL